MRGATKENICLKWCDCISIHAPHARSDSARRMALSIPSHFNPRSSCEERLWVSSVTPLLFYFNPRSSCEERRDVKTYSAQSYTISIHAPHARSDLWVSPSYRHGRNFNPRSSCEERPNTAFNKSENRIFQSTLLMRGATVLACSALVAALISIHAPHARSDCVNFRH